MQTIGSHELKAKLSKVLDAVEHGETIVVTRHGKPIARIVPSEPGEQACVAQAVEGLMSFPRKKLPKGVTVLNLIEQGRR